MMSGSPQQHIRSPEMQAKGAQVVVRTCICLGVRVGIALYYALLS